LIQKCSEHKNKDYGHLALDVEVEGFPLIKVVLVWVPEVPLFQTNSTCFMGWGGVYGIVA
jgi:hypothetical protein